MIALFSVFILILSTANCFPLHSTGDNYKLDEYDADFKVYHDKSSVISFSKPQHSVADSFECTLCRVALDAALWKFRTPDKKYTGLYKFVIKICIDLKIETPEICTGMIHAMKNETAYLLANLNATGSMICGLIFQAKCRSRDLSWNSDEWIVPLPPPPPKTTTYLSNSKTKAPVLNVLQISDIHIDLKYTPGSKVNCKEPLCCRQPAKSGDVRAGYWGSHGYCDSPYWLVENFLEHVSKEKFDYIIWTGDLPAHDVWDQSRSEQEYLISNLTKSLLKYFPDTPVYPALGNHESFPVNSFPPNYVKGYNNIGWLYDSLYIAWSPWLSNDALNSVKKSGFYTMIIKPGLRLVSLNMNYCNNENFWMLINPKDPNGELQWLVNTLYDAEKKDEFVHIIGHIPPTIGGDCLDIWRNNYYAIITRFKLIVKGQFFGHTHKDQFEILYTNSSLTEPVAVAYISPSITTFSNLNPGYRTYQMDSNSWEVQDHQTYFLNLTKANQPNAKPEWEFEYSAKSSYNMTSLSVHNWDRLFKSWLLQDANENNPSFDDYYKYFYKNYPPSKGCNDACRKKLLCMVAAGNFTTSYCS